MAWKMFRVDEIVNMIDAGECVLPVIQRDFVWGTEKIELLFDTLLKGQNFGGIMAILEEQGHTPLFAYRRFSKDGCTTGSTPPNEKLEHRHYFIIDGQQRLQSFYIGLKPYTSR